MRSRIKLLAIIAAFIGPVFIATILYFSSDRSILPPAKSHGELISPAQPLAPLAAEGLAANELPENIGAGKWTLIYWGTQLCDLFCQTELFKMRQVRLSVGKDLGRLRTLYLAKRADSPDMRGEPLERLNQRNPQLLVAELGENSALKQQMDKHPLNGIYLVDPMGNLMMRYSDTSTSKGMLKDIKKLLKISKIG